MVNITLRYLDDYPSGFGLGLGGQDGDLLLGAVDQPPFKLVDMWTDLLRYRYRSVERLQDRRKSLRGR